MFGKGKDGSGLGKFLRKKEMGGVVHWVQKYKDAKDLQQGLCIVVLAAGSGTRMNSDLPQVNPYYSMFHDLAEVSVFDALLNLNFSRDASKTVVLGI